MKRRKITFIILFFLLFSTTYFILLNEKNRKIENFLAKKTEEVSQNYTALYSYYSKLSKVIFDTKIDTNEVKTIFKLATQGTVQEKNLSRDRLYLQLLSTYKHLKTYNIKQLHFHLPNNESYLRFHRPERYGDDLSKIRESVAYVNKNRVAVDGFEEGRIYNGYRFVFPLFEDEYYLGSVEISFSTLVMSINYMDNYGVLSNFLISKEIVNKKVFKNEYSNYTDSLFDEYFTEVSIIRYIENVTKMEEKRPISKDTEEIVKQNKKSLNSFSHFDTLRKKVFTFLKVKNPITQKPVGVFVVISDASYILENNMHFYRMLILTTLFIALLLHYIYKSNIYRYSIEKKNLELQLEQKRTQELNKTLEDKVIQQVQEMRESAHIHKTIFNTVNDGMAIIDLDLNFLLVNDAYVTLLGYTKEELYSHSFLDYTAPSMIPQAMEVLEILLKDGFYKNFHKSCITKEKKTIDVVLDAVLMPNKKQILLAIKDVTLENKLKQEKLLQEHYLLQQVRFIQMGEMISMIAHQWRQPLGSISAVASNLKIRLDLDYFKLESKKGREEMLLYFHERIDNINQYVKSLSTTIDDFRNFYKSDKIPVKVTLSHVVDKALNIIKTSLVNDNIDLQYENISSLKIELHDSEMMQVILNILKNAQDNFEEKKLKNKKIKIEVEDKKITIYDNGGGIDETIIENIFDPYFSTKDAKNGTGIGLYMSKIIVEEHHHGTLKVQNIENGVSFTIKL